MRKLAWLLIILAILTPTMVAAGLAYPDPVGNGLHFIFVKTIGEGGANMLIGVVTGMFLWGSANGLQAAAVLVGIWITGGIMWVCIKKFLWDRRPSVMKSAEAKIYQHAPTQTLPQTVTEQATQPVNPAPVESKKEEEAVAK